MHFPIISDLFLKVEPDKIYACECIAWRHIKVANTFNEARCRSGNFMAEGAEVAAVTGAGQGIGRGIALVLARRGCTVCVLDCDAAAAEVSAAQPASCNDAFHVPVCAAPMACVGRLMRHRAKYRHQHAPAAIRPVHGRPETQVGPYQAVCGEIRAAGGTAHSVPTDVTQPAAVEAAVGAQGCPMGLAGGPT
jgi:hypothetical protein